MERKKVLVVDDEPNILELIDYNLSESGYEVTKVSDGVEAMEVALNNEFDLIILDVMLPSKNGMDICRDLRSVHNIETPIIMLTAKKEEIDKILGLEFGADDYVSKPFSVRELMARIKAVLRRYENMLEKSSSKKSGSISKNGENKIEVLDIVIDVNRHEVTKKGELIELALKEFELLKTLAENRGKVMTREILLDNIWGFDYFGETRTVDVHIRYLRKKLGDEEGYIQTIRGVGYKMI